MMRRMAVLVFVLVPFAAGVAGVAQWNSVVGSDNPFHWYRFDEGSGVVCGDSGSVTLNGTYSGVVLGREGLLEGSTAGEFTGSSIVDFGQASAISSDWTAEYIVKKTGSLSQALHDDVNTSLRVQGWNMAGLSFTQYGVADYQFSVVPGQSVVAPVGEWIHLVFRKTASKTEAFIDGQLVGTQSNTVNLPLQTLGGRRGSGSDALYGFLDEAVIYNRALPDERIRIHADACTGSFSVALPDDFETYADTTELQGSWNSSGQLSLETVETHGGGKSMKAVLSTASVIGRDFGEDFDYGYQDGKDLVLWFKGDAANTEGDVSLRVFDGGDNVIGSFAYRGVTTATGWTVMGFGVDVAQQPGWSQVRKVQIDISVPCTMYFDDLVFQDRPLRLNGDLNGDNRVDRLDLDIFGGQWLDESCYGVDCADFDGVDGVGMGDFGVLAGNWNFDPSGLVISEFMAINSYVPFVNPTDIHTTIKGQTEHPDWIEIHNTDVENAFNLNGWYLTDDPDNKAKWKFPDAPIAADGYLIVFASQKKYADHPDNYPYVDDAGNLHTNFQLGNNGEYLALVKHDGVTVAYEYAPEYPRQFGLISFGVDNEGRTGFLKSPTPGSPNVDSWTDVVADTTFSVKRGFYQAGQTLNVVISCATDGAVIRYTLDGSTPSLANGTDYIEGNPVVINSTTCLRAAAFKTGWLSTNVDTQTYIYLDDVIVQSPNGAAPPGWPSGSVNGQVFDYGMDPDVVQSAEYGPLMMQAMTAIPSISLVTDMANLTDPGIGIYVNATREGIMWERPVSAELIYPDGTEGFQSEAGLRIRGAYSRTGSNPKHSFRLLFKGGYGNTKLEYPIFGDEGPDKFDNIDLRTAQNYAWSNWGNDGRRNTLVRDVYSRDLQREMNQPYTRSRYYHLYVNGQYWGIFQSQERSEASYAETYFGGYEEDYDVIKTDNYRTSYTDGSLDAWNKLWWLCDAGVETDEKYYAIQGKGPDGNDDPDIAVHVDVENLVDYMLDIFFAANRDAPVTLGGDRANNFYAIRNRDPRLRQGWKFFAYDSEHSMLSANEDRTITVSAGSQIAHFNPQWLHQKMMVNSRYRLKFADRAHRHMFNGGAMTTARATDLLLARAAEIDMAIIGESARWGDQRSDRTDNPYTKAHWWAEVNGYLAGTFLPGRRNVVLNQLRNRQLYPNVEAPAFGLHGGYVANGYTLTMSAPGGTIYYTIDGTDPYQQPLDTAMEYTSPVPLDGSTHVKARVVSQGTSSALNEAVFAVGPVWENLRITEIMYHPADPNTEFIELQNVGSEAVNVSLVKFVNSVDFTFGSLTVDPGGYVLVVENLSEFAKRYDTTSLTIAGEYTGKLDNGGERIELVDALGKTILDFGYKDGWYDITDGGGFSLTVIDAPNTDALLWDDKDTWKASTRAGGSPGEGDTGPSPGDVVINEVLAHSDIELYDWIELYNATDSEINIGGWFISDNDDDDPNLMKYRIAEGTTISKDDFILFNEYDHFGYDSSDVGRVIPFALSENGETVHLTRAEGGVLTGLRISRTFGASLPDVAFGEYIKSTGGTDFVAMSENSPGVPNKYPAVGPVVISEIMYHPAGSREAEYVELLNISGSAVELYDSGTGEPWRFVDGGGIEYYLRDPDTMGFIAIAAGERILLVKDVASFEGEFSAEPGTRIFQWDSRPLNDRGSLNNRGERIEVSMPGDVDGLGIRQYIRVDRVNYSDGTHPAGADPWPIEADGSGQSLHRRVGQEYGNDVINWQAGAATPGA